MTHLMAFFLGVIVGIQVGIQLQILRDRRIP